MFQLIRFAFKTSHTQDLSAPKLRRTTMIIASLTANQAVSFAIPDMYLILFPGQKWSWALLLNFSNVLFNAIIFVIMQKELRQFIVTKFRKTTSISVFPLSSRQKAHNALGNTPHCW